MTGVPPYSVGELTARPGTQARGGAGVGLGPMVAAWQFIRALDPRGHARHGRGLAAVLSSLAVVKGAGRLHRRDICG